jgi:hypothetical protein
MQEAMRVLMLDWAMLLMCVQAHLKDIPCESNTAAMCVTVGSISSMLST